MNRIGGMAVGILLAALADPSPVRAARGSGQGCPPDHPGARRVAVAFLSATAYAQDAAALGLGPRDTVHLQPLADRTDARTCAAIRALMANDETASHPWVHSFYRVGSYYLVGVVREPVAGPVTENGTTWYELGFGAIGVLDARLNVIGVYAA